MQKAKLVLYSLFFMVYGAQAQTLRFEGQEFEITNVKASVTQLSGETVLKVERDLELLPFDADRLEATVDEPTFVKLKGIDMEEGTLEVKVLSRLLPTAPKFARGFIGVAFHINDQNSAYESIYLRPTNGRAEDQIRRNHTVQYYAYPDYKFSRLRKEAMGEYETYADIGLDEWISMRIEFDKRSARLYLNNQEFPSFIVKQMLGRSASGSIGLWVEIGTEGYFKDLRIFNYP